MFDIKCDDCGNYYKGSLLNCPHCPPPEKQIETTKQNSLKIENVPSKTAPYRDIPNNFKKCECGKEIYVEAGKCPNCGKPQTKRSTWTVLIGIIFLFSIIIAIPAMFSGGNKTQTNSSPSSSATYAPAVSTGKNGILDSGGELVPVAINEEAFEDFIKASVAEDKHGITLLLASMSVFGVKKGTKVLVVDRSLFKRKVRILDGDQEGMAGWVAMEHVK